MKLGSREIICKTIHGSLPKENLRSPRDAEIHYFAAQDLLRESYSMIHYVICKGKVDGRLGNDSRVEEPEAAEPSGGPLLQ